MSTRREFLAGSAALSVANRLVGGTEGPTGSNSIMRSYRLPHTDLEVSRIAFGCDFWGLPRDASVDDIAQVARLVNVAHENGITLFDTAEAYGGSSLGGSSEAVLGQVLAQSPGLRHKVVIQTKCDGWQSRAAIISSAEGSLKRLGTDYLDILLLHIQYALMEPEEVASAFEDLKRTGKVRYFGVSNHTISRIELLKRSVRQPLIVNQVHLGLAHSGLLDEPNWSEGSMHIGPYAGIAGLDYSRLNDMQVQAYSPLRGKSVVGKADLLGPPTEAPAELKEAATKLHELATKKGTTPAAIALAWLLRHPGRILPIIGARRTEHIVESCAADRIELSEEEWNALFEAAPKET